MIRRSIAACVLVSSALGAIAAWAAGCGSDVVNNPNYGEPDEASAFNPGQGGGGSGYGSGGNAGGGETGAGSLDAGPPQCPDSLKTCGETFTYPFNNETSVELRGNYAPGAWTAGTAMTHVGAVWSVTVQVPWGVPVEFKLFVDGTTWETDPTQPTATDDAGDVNNVMAAITCPASYTCTQPGALAPGVFDWRDAVIYFVFVDRFFDGNSANNCNVAGASTAQYTSANYLGGDWAGVAQQRFELRGLQQAFFAPLARACAGRVERCQGARNFTRKCGNASLFCAPLSASQGHPCAACIERAQSELCASQRHLCLEALKL